MRLYFYAFIIFYSSTNTESDVFKPGSKKPQGLLQYNNNNNLIYKTCFYIIIWNLIFFSDIINGLYRSAAAFIFQKILKEHF